MPQGQGASSMTNKRGLPGLTDCYDGSGVFQVQPLGKCSAISPAVEDISSRSRLFLSSSSITHTTHTQSSSRYTPNHSLSTSSLATHTQHTRYSESRCCHYRKSRADHLQSQLDNTITMPASVASSVASIIKPNPAPKCGESCDCCGCDESCWCVVM
jgi:hypothetical protein